MGLDMYLNRKKTIYFFKNLKTPEEDVKLREVLCETKDINSDALKFVTITEEGIYWRKANQIHRWFVHNVQGGEDDCRRYPINREQLEELLRLVKSVLENPNKKEDILPTKGGFFFGSEEYDDYYFEDLKHTREGLERLLKNWDDSYDYYYASSW